MRKRQLGNTDLHLTAIGFGAWAIGGGDWDFGWGPQDDDESVKTIHKALDSGINWIDTAAIYGLGRSEEVVARALAEYPGGKDVIVATKCSMRWHEDRSIYRDLTTDSVKEECHNSLRRLKTDTIDLYQIHWPEPLAQIEEGWRAIQDLIAEGKIRHAGVSNFNVPQMERVAPIGPIASLQPPYHMLERNVEAEILSYCGKNNIGVVAYSPMASGLLTGKFTKEKIAALPDEDWRKKYNRNFQGEKFERNMELIEKLRALAAEFDRTPAQLAIAWVLRRPEVTCAIVGARKVEQVPEIAGAGDWVLDEATIERVERLLAEYA
ncbi:MAG: aldo/keto reductase [Deltaproteobacteria bacterium]|nr:aldo/keto reductase [Deltaproteobacteria bacterium]MCB9478621.1 aldo/keto reductase [Deltaproteobacteria bacterium]MCB9490115.1 aldo/keto reductase [Deltaproteobacteria bacterium]